jgi:DNA processing protein
MRRASDRGVQDTAPREPSEGVDLPEEAFALGLAMLPKVGPATLRRLLHSTLPSTAWTRASAEASEVPVLTKVWRNHLDHGIHVILPGHQHYPSRLRGDPKAPPILFCLGAREALDGSPTVAIVGTRSPTRYGIGIAAQLGTDLAAAGVSVVSGLALGIDAAAHEGACGAGSPPIAVVAGGLDEPYPRHHARLWERVADSGAILSESPAGTPTEKWRFPTRNKLLAAMSDVVVVVESRHGGGSKHTVDAALERGTLVGAVPGSIRSPASEGPNRLIADGAFPVCSSGDILLALSMSGAQVPSGPPPRGRPASGRTVTSGLPSGDDRSTYDALTADPVPLDDLARLTGLALPELCGSLERLAHAGLAHDAGGWWERA